MLSEMNYLCLRLGRPKSYGAPKTWSLYPAVTEINKKLDGWSTVWRVGQRDGDKQLPCPSSNWELKISSHRKQLLRISQWTRLWFAHWKLSTIRMLYIRSSKVLRKINSSKNLFATRNANVTCSLGCSNN